jgi:hypothetical protein
MAVAAADSAEHREDGHRADIDSSHEAITSKHRAAAKPGVFRQFGCASMCRARTTWLTGLARGHKQDGIMSKSLGLRGLLLGLLLTGAGRVGSSP